MAPVVSSRPDALDAYAFRSSAERMLLPMFRSFLTEATTQVRTRCIEPAIRTQDGDEAARSLDRLAEQAAALEALARHTATEFRRADMGSLTYSWNASAEAAYKAAKLAGKWVPKRRPEWTMLRFSTGDGGRLIESMGDLATATHIVVMVPGMTNELSNVDRDFRPRSQLLYDEMVARAKPGESVALVMWLGYRNPQISDAYNAIGSEMARTGAVTLNADLAAISAHTTAQITVVAHSFGTILAGEAMDRDIPADRVVVLGSPGMNASSRKDLGSPSTRLYASSVGEKPSGPVAVLRAIGTALVASPIPIVGDLETAVVETATGRDWAASTSNVGLHGADPAKRSFGSTVFASDHLGHSAYFVPQSLGLTNISLISLGREPVQSISEAGPANRPAIMRRPTTPAKTPATRSAAKSVGT